MYLVSGNAFPPSNLQHARRMKGKAQVELSESYSIVLHSSAVMHRATPLENNVIMGDWIIRHTISKGSYDHVNVTTNVLYCTY